MYPCAAASVILQAISQLSFLWGNRRARREAMSQQVCLVGRGMRKALLMEGEMLLFGPLMEVLLGMKLPSNGVDGWINGL